MRAGARSNSLFLCVNVSDVGPVPGGNLGVCTGKSMFPFTNLAGRTGRFPFQYTLIKKEKLACLLRSSWFIEKKESAFGFSIWLL